jgi:ubiquinone/menaquinone biosynthesis C-methylase UbiE
MSKTLLHVGCGAKNRMQTTPGFRGDGWDEIRLDIDPAVRPDIVGTMTDMSGVPDSRCDALFSSHNIEHLYAHEVPLALREFRRVLKPGGFAVITCPDQQSICAEVAEDRLTQTAYQSPAGPIAPIDMLYGLRSALARGNLYMAHRSGFTLKVLVATLRQAGFERVAARRRVAPHYDLWALATAAPLDEVALRDLAAQHFPA